MLIIQFQLTYLIAVSQTGYISRDHRRSITGTDAGSRKSVEEGFYERIGLEIQRQQWTLAGKPGSDRRLTKAADAHPRGLA